MNPWIPLALFLIPSTLSLAQHPAELSLSRVFTLNELAQAQNSTPPQDHPLPIESGQGLTGNWNGARDELAQRGLHFGGFVLFDNAKILRGGLDTEAWPVSYLLDLHCYADLEKLAGFSGGGVFVDFQSHDQSASGDAIVGDLQSYDNITAPRFVQVAQLFYRQRFTGGLSIKIGKIDANADAAEPDSEAFDGFSLLEHSGDFLQSSAVYTPTMFALPTYPAGAPGMEVFFGTPLYLGLGAFYNNTHQTFLTISGFPESTQASSGGMFFIGEVGARWNAGELPGHAGAGGWFHNGRFPRNADGGATKVRGTGGGYVFIDQTLFLRELRNGQTCDLGAFFIAGLADKTTAPMDRSLTLGINAAGFISGRPDDSMGVLCSWVHIPGRPGLIHSCEIAAEIYYKFQLTPWASLKPDFQYIVNPAGAQRDAAVVALRAEIDF